MHVITYFIAGNFNFARFLIWRLGEFSKVAKCLPMMLSIQIAKFKFHQYQVRAVLPNLMLAKVTRYTVVHSSTTCTRSHIMRKLWSVMSQSYFNIHTLRIAKKPLLSHPSIENSPGKANEEGSGGQQMIPECWTKYFNETHNKKKPRKHHCKNPGPMTSFNL